MFVRILKWEVWRLDVVVVYRGRLVNLVRFGDFGFCDIYLLEICIGRGCIKCIWVIYKFLNGSF